MDSLTGQLLVAAPSLSDPNFARAVVLVCEHGPHGALGLVLNRPGEDSVGDLVPDLASGLGEDEAMFTGGPVRPDSVLVLAEWRDPAASAGLVVGAIGLLGEAGDVATLGDDARRARAYAGFAGWGPGQLDAELEREDWILAAARADAVFSEEPEEMWGAVLRDKGGRFALLARMPDDPSLN